MNYDNILKDDNKSSGVVKYIVVNDFRKIDETEDYSDMDSEFSETFIQEHEDELLEKIKEEAFEYYKRFRNLNDYYYKTDNPASRKRFDQWVQEFYEKLQGIENKAKSEDKNEPFLKRK
jgi:hypothetical protein